MKRPKQWWVSIRRHRGAVNLSRLTRLTAQWLSPAPRPTVLLEGRCLLCAGPGGRQALCPDCLRGLPWPGPACPQCALPAGDERYPCGACLLRPPPWRSARAGLRYTFPVDTLVRQLKYGRQLAAGRALAQAMLELPSPAISRDRNQTSPWLVPVPLHWLRETARGFNQAREIANHLARETGWPVRGRWLRRDRSTPPQAGLDAAQRRRNLARAFQWHGPSLAGQQIILVDDVMTTGATAAACCQALAAARDVHLWVAARTPRP